ncbi:hypothetical protein AAG570_011507 [Ranatra chinensis]|uniref:CAP-Gly domain-containing protein n=1 Tax=Ranatra chinensis TaxID=642074 RepID=A0ABD0YKU6_9HEMI
MVLRVYDKDDKIVCILSNNDALLGSFQIDDGMRLHVEDKFLLRKQIDEDTGVGKFEMPLEEYAKRTDSLQAYLKGNKLGKYNAEEMEKREAERKKEEEIEEAKITNFKLGDRCEISVPGQPVRRATIMFIGEVKFKPGKWVGIKYDEPLGKNDGMVEGVRYFECSPKYGGFVKPLYVEVGDFPEEEFNLEDEL